MGHSADSRILHNRLRQAHTADRKVDRNEDRWSATIRTKRAANREQRLVVSCASFIATIFCCKTHSSFSQSKESRLYHVISTSQKRSNRSCHTAKSQSFQRRSPSSWPANARRLSSEIRRLCLSRMRREYKTSWTFFVQSTRIDATSKIARIQKSTRRTKRCVYFFVHFGYKICGHICRSSKILNNSEMPNKSKHSKEFVVAYQNAKWPKSNVHNSPISRTKSSKRRNRLVVFLQFLLL